MKRENFADEMLETAHGKMQQSDSNVCTKISVDKQSSAATQLIGAVEKPRLLIFVDENWW